MYEEYPQVLEQYWIKYTVYPQVPAENQRPNQALSPAAASVSFINHHMVKRLTGQGREGRFCFAVDKAHSLPSLVFCRLAGSISD